MSEVNLRRVPNIRKNGRPNTTGPGPEDFRWLCNLSVYDMPAALRGLAKAAETAGYPDISYKLATLAGDPMMYQYTVDPEAIKKEITRESFSTHGGNDFYVYDRSIELFGKLYGFCRAGYSTLVWQGKKEAAWQHGFRP